VFNPRLVHRHGWRYDLLRRKGIGQMKTLALWIIAICYLAQTVAVYGPDQDGGGSIFFGNFGYYFEGESK